MSDTQRAKEGTLPQDSSSGHGSMPPWCRPCVLCSQLPDTHLPDRPRTAQFTPAALV